MRDIRARLSHLLNKITSWNWTKEYEAGYRKMKTIISSELLLTQNDPSMPMIVAADPSAFELVVFIWLQLPEATEKDIMQVSRTLPSAKRKFSQMEKEPLALVFAVSRFHKFLYGRGITSLTNHKLLFTIFGSKSVVPAHSANHLQ
ncbi:unnamed protein product [Schistosoma margrebowiei]|uniref:Uncharacterized protein n=1 Tax=Schistosoma margrebowiei TaxID=48269 RepID=A0A183M8P4_9TREM|nr:unnamed protein product [Schistosoma margrebowiei]